MTKQGKIIVGIAITAVIAFIVWQLIKYYNAKKAIEGSTVAVGGLNGSEGTATGSGAPFSSDAFPLKLYSGGERVKNLQKVINNFVIVTGIYSGKVLTEDGKLGDKTLALLNPMKKTLSLPENGQVSESEYNIYIKPVANMTTDEFAAYFYKTY